MREEQFADSPCFGMATIAGTHLLADEGECAWVRE